jgi:hypothetical protein
MPTGSICVLSARAIRNNEFMTQKIQIPTKVGRGNNQLHPANNVTPTIRFRYIREREPEIDSKYRPGGLDMRQIFISALMEAGTRDKRRYASSRDVRVLGSANGGDVVAAIGVTMRQAKGMHGQASITAYNSPLRF